MLARKSIVCLDRIGIMYRQQRNVQLSIIGAASDIGSNLALLLKQNPKITKLKLHDYDEKVKGIAVELNLLPGGPAVCAFAGECSLPNALISSDAIIMVARTARRHGILRTQMLEANGPAVQKVCKAMSDRNPTAFLAISTSPINCIIPYATALLYKYNAYNPFKVLGITQIDSARSRTYAGEALNVPPMELNVPVIGGHSEETLIPLFSHLTPDSYSLDSYQVDMLTCLVRNAGTEVIKSKGGIDSATLAMAWSLNEFVCGLVDAISGEKVELNCYSANTQYGTRYFSCPTTLGPLGITDSSRKYQMSNLEESLLAQARKAINKDVHLGEDYAHLVY